jgi:hypothetical protein
MIYMSIVINGELSQIYALKYSSINYHIIIQKYYIILYAKIQKLSHSQKS